MIALAYSFCGSQFIVERALYPRMWDDVRDFTATTRRELAPMSTRLFWIQFLAVSIPLVAAILLRAARFDRKLIRRFKYLVTGLIVLGIIGYQLTTRVTRHLTETAAALTGIKA